MDIEPGEGGSPLRSRCPRTHRRWLHSNRSIHPRVALTSARISHSISIIPPLQPLFPASRFNFFDTLSGDLGGFAFCLDPSCHNEWNLFGGALFDNNNANPTLLTGPFTIDQTLSGYFVGGRGPFPFGVAPCATPEPFSLLLLGTGLVVLFGWGRRKFLA